MRSNRKYYRMILVIFNLKHLEDQRSQTVYLGGIHRCSVIFLKKTAGTQK